MNTDIFQKQHCCYPPPMFSESRTSSILKFNLVFSKAPINFGSTSGILKYIIDWPPRALALEIAPSQRFRNYNQFARLFTRGL